MRVVLCYGSTSDVAVLRRELRRATPLYVDASCSLASVVCLCACVCLRVCVLCVVATGLECLPPTYLMATFTGLSAGSKGGSPKAVCVSARVPARVASVCFPRCGLGAVADAHWVCPPPLHPWLGCRRSAAGTPLLEVVRGGSGKFPLPAPTDMHNATHISMSPSSCDQLVHRFDPVQYLNML